LNVKHASALAGCASAALVHVLVNVFERTSSEELSVRARPTHRFAAQDNDVRVVHELGVVLSLHVAPASVVT
jgi:hypothetical protein